MSFITHCVHDWLTKDRAADVDALVERCINDGQSIMTGPPGEGSGIVLAGWLYDYAKDRIIDPEHPRIVAKLLGCALALVDFQDISQNLLKKEVAE